MQDISRSVAEQLKLLKGKIDSTGSTLEEEVEWLREQNKLQAQKIVTLERRVDNYEAYTRQNNVIITRLVMKHRLYARVA